MSEQFLNFSREKKRAILEGANSSRQESYNCQKSKVFGQIKFNLRAFLRPIWNNERQSTLLGRSLKVGVSL